MSILLGEGMAAVGLADKYRYSYLCRKHEPTITKSWLID